MAPSSTSTVRSTSDELAVLNTPIAHPQILEALASAGHKSLVLVADAFFAAMTTTGPNSARVYLNLEAGYPTVPHVVDLIARMVPIEKLTTMRTPDNISSDVSTEVVNLLGRSVDHEAVDRSDFYKLARSTDLALCIVTGDTRRFANAMLRIGSGVLSS
jgi:L-fucose mutarotase